MNEPFGALETLLGTDGLSSVVWLESVWNAVGREAAQGRVLAGLFSTVERGGEEHTQVEDLDGGRRRGLDGSD